MSRPVLLHLLSVLLGYVLAVLVATTIVCLLFAIPTVLPDGGRFGSFHQYLKDFPAMFFVGAMMTAIYALPGWLVSVIAAERQARRGKFWFAIAGLATAALAILIAGRFQQLFSESALNVFILIGGLFGGLAYWAVAGKQSGAWRQRA